MSDISKLEYEYMMAVRALGRLYGPTNEDGLWRWQKT